MLPATAPIVGRHQDLNRLRAAVQSSRLVTVHGGAGIGKTRLAVELLYGLDDGGEDTAFVDLAALEDGGDVGAAIASTLRAATAGETPDDAVVRYLSDRDAVIVLDNCEHVLDGVIPAVSRILAETTGTRLVCTSRDVLGLPAETIYPLAPLTVPSELRRGTSSAVEMFVEVARRGTPGRAFDSDEEAIIGEICDLLEGVPLAIELAATRTRSLSLRDLLTRLQEPLTVTRSSRTDTPSRHRDLRNALEWSYSLCSPDERRAWARLSVLRGSFSRPAAHAILARSEDASEATAAHDDGVDLASLIDKSVIALRPEFKTESRYRMLDLVRRFGREVLDAEAATADVQNTHAAHFAAQYGDLELRATEPGAGARLRMAITDLPNYRSALAYSTGEAAPRAPLDGLVVDAVSHVLWRVGALQEGLHWFERSLELPDLPDLMRRRMLAGAAIHLVRFGKVAEGASLLERAREGLPAAGEERDRVEADCRLTEAVSLIVAGRPRDAELLTRAILDHAFGPITHSQTMRRRQALTHALMIQGDVASAAAVCETMLHELPPDEISYSHYALRMLGLAAWARGDVEAAHSHAARTIALLRDVGVGQDVADTLRLAVLVLDSEGAERAAAELFGALTALDNQRQDGLLLTIIGQGAREDFDRFEHFRTSRPVDWRRGYRMTVAEAADAAYSALTDTTAGQPIDESTLTSRERQVAALIARGLSNKQIAANLAISVRTVEVHAERIRSKLGVLTRVDVANALRDGLGPDLPDTG